MDNGNVLHLSKQKAEAEALLEQAMIDCGLESSAPPAPDTPPALKAAPVPSPPGKADLKFAARLGDFQARLKAEEDAKLRRKFRM